MGVLRGRLSFTQWAMISSSEGRLGLYRNSFCEVDDFRIKAGRAGHLESDRILYTFHEL